MLEISSILMMSMVLLSLSIILIILFLKHINIMYVFIGEIRKSQTSIHKDIVEIKLNIARIISEGLKHIEYREESVINDAKEKKDSKVIKIPKINLDSLPDNARNKKDIKEEFDGDISDLKSSQVSEDELLKLIGDKELMFKKQISVSPGEMFIDANINIDEEN